MTHKEKLREIACPGCGVVQAVRVIEVEYGGRGGQARRSYPEEDQECPVCGHAWEEPDV